MRHGRQPRDDRLLGLLLALASSPRLELRRLALVVPVIGMLTAAVIAVSRPSSRSTSIRSRTRGPSARPCGTSPIPGDEPHTGTWGVGSCRAPTDSIGELLRSSAGTLSPSIPGVSRSPGPTGCGGIRCPFSRTRPTPAPRPTERRRAQLRRRPGADPAHQRLGPNPGCHRPTPLDGRYPAHDSPAARVCALSLQGRPDDGALAGAQPGFQPLRPGASIGIGEHGIREGDCRAEAAAVERGGRSASPWDPGIRAGASAGPCSTARNCEVRPSIRIQPRPIG